MSRSTLVVALVAAAHARAAWAQPGAVDPLDDIRITVGAVTVGNLPAERDDRWSVEAQAVADGRGVADGLVAGGGLGLAAELHHGTADCVRSIDLSGQVRGAAGDLPGVQYAARARGCLAGVHILRELSLGVDGNLVPPLSLGRGLRSLPLDRVSVGGGFAMLSIATREGTIDLAPGRFEYQDVGQQAPGEPAAHFGDFTLDFAMVSVRGAGDDAGSLDFLFFGVREVGGTAAGPGATALSMGLLRLAGTRGAWHVDGDLSLQIGELPLPGTMPAYLDLTTGGGGLGIERRGDEQQVALRYHRGFTPATREVILEDRVDASLSVPRGPTSLGVRGFAALTRAWTGPAGPQHRGVTGGAGVDWIRALPHRSQLAISAELARSYYATLGPAEPVPTTGARLVVTLATELAGSR